MNLDEAKLVRRSVVIERMLFFIDEYYRAFKKPVAMSILSAKYSRMSMNCGGFPEIIEELTHKGTIKVYFLRSGAKVVYPFDGDDSVARIDSIKL